METILEGNERSKICSVTNTHKHILSRHSNVDGEPHYSAAFISVIVRIHARARAHAYVHILQYSVRYLFYRNRKLNLTIHETRVVF